MLRLTKYRSRLLKKSFLISFIYVGFGTFSLMGILTTSPFYNELFYLGVLICIPVDFIGMAILFTEGDSVGLVLLIQLLIFFIFWFAVYSFFVVRERKQ